MSPQPNDPVLEITHSILTEAAQRPWLAALLMRRKPYWLTRLAHLAQRVRDLPRHTRRTLRRKLASGLAAAALLLALAGTPTAWAAGSMTVTPGAAGFTNGDGCSLAEAIVNANNGNSTTYPECAGADNTGGNTITLPASATLSYAAALSADTALPDITSQITIEATGSTIQRSGASTDFRILNIAPTGDLTLNQATITGGNLTGLGGGVNNEGTLTVQASDIISNTTVYVYDSGGSGGGGIFSSGKLTVTNNSTLSGNTAGGLGGGILSTNPVTVQDSTVSGNTAYYGGGIVNYGGTLTVTNSTLSGNTAYNSGGGIANSAYGTLTVQGSTLSGNTAYSYGGGIVNYSGTLTVTNSTLSNNLANNSGEGRAYGGAIFNQGIATVQSSSLITNTASNTDVGLAAGGAIYNNNSGTLTVQNSTISGNSTTADAEGRYARGGGVFNIGTLTMTHSTVANNNAYAFYSEGGGIFGTATISNSIVANNTLGPAVENDCASYLSSGGYNIESGASCGFNQTGDQQNVGSASLNLQPLANNGVNPHPDTHALGTDSVAIDQIPIDDGSNNTGCVAGISTDERGAVRAGGVNRGGSACDIGAYEVSSETPTAITLRDLTATPNSSSGIIGAIGTALTALGALVIGRKATNRHRNKRMISRMDRGGTNRTSPVRLACR